MSPSILLENRNLLIDEQTQKIVSPRAPVEPKKNKCKNKILRHILFSLAQEMMKKAQELNITYHPILENFKKFDNVPRTEFNESLKSLFGFSIQTGILLNLTIKDFCKLKVCIQPTQFAKNHV